MSDRNKAIIAIFLSSIFGGAVSTVIKIAVRQIPPFNFSFIRFLIASICLFPLFMKKKPKFDVDFGKLILISLLATANIAFFVIGIKTTTASIGQMLYAGTPLIVGTLGYIIFGHKLPLKKWFFILIGLVGVSVVIILPIIHKKSAFSGDLIGNVLILLGVISWSFYALLSKQMQKKYSPIVITAVFCFVATFLFLLLSFFELSQNNYWWNNLSPGAIVGVLYVSLFATVGTYLLNQYALKFSNAVLGSLSLYLQPIFAFVTAYLLLGEKLNFGLFLGTVLVFTSIALTTYSK
ncbi:hypothetical protein A2774_00835 [Candidatus Roizmanbacteria bacterium RIFCSPHIGHO2_01_FULL_39_12c]|uniref:EamA domain-containing protein n=1 Tax=Candidatus Roizmanbacteria bacterium RIFCSPHIGHO2_01_FULL_39_12c TaxID=1802031 RepID=A0A1F7GF32_9BACT|nr:MAG: hypothetical protein A2774_00835 [Candidatus Roizmanbacteria bacterium RIFCSPHIGHO2_01_FULL_39_12c]OGK46537.1 MAG: hypothetical protein A2963_02250 [Candidatus Roizmanbacteria bacterium RIFCSPLOWO2_01_FULL_40_13]